MLGSSEKLRIKLKLLKAKMGVRSDEAVIDALLTRSLVEKPKPMLKNYKRKKM